MSLKENSSNHQKLYKIKSRGSNMNGNGSNGGGGGGGGGNSIGSGNNGNGLSNSPKSCNSNNTLITNTQYINTKYHNNSNNNNNNYNNYPKSESSSPNQQYHQQQQQRYSPKIRNSYSYSSTSPFKKSNHQLSYSPDHKYRQILTGNDQQQQQQQQTPVNSNNIISLSPTNGGVAVPNPFGGSKYRDPPPALSLPLPPVQWTLTTTDDVTTTSTTPAMHTSASFPITSTCSSDLVTQNDILQKLNHGFRLSTAVKA